MKKLKLLFYADIGGSGGYQRYCKGLLNSKAIPDDIQIFLVISKSFLEKISPINDNINIYTHSWMDHKSKIKRYLWHLWIYPRIIKKVNPEIEFYANGHLRVYHRKAKTVATCHNLLLFDNSEIERISNLNEKKYFYKSSKRYKKSFYKCNALIYLSNYSQEVISHELLQDKKSKVISHGLDSVFKFKINRSYKFKSKIEILYVSPIYHYKHQLEVAKAVHLLKNQTGLNIHLSFIGGGSSSAAVELKSWINEKKLNNIITITEYVDTVILKNAYNRADIFVFASSCETFGITLLEAMGAKLPIACSNKSGLNDILKDAGVYFNPSSPDSILKALNILIKSEQLRKDLGEKAYALSLEYSWEKCAIETYNFIKSMT